MKSVIAIFVIALVFAPVASLQPQSHYHSQWPGTYAHWHPSDSQWEAIYIAYNDSPPPKSDPNDRWFCLGSPWLCGCPPTGCGT